MIRGWRPAIAVAILTMATLPVAAQDAITTVAATVDKYRSQAEKTALQIWDFAEVGYQETKSSTLLQQQLRDAGFTVEAGVAGMPTAFVATYGSGKPVVGILAEFDALPGITQQAKPERTPASGKDAGHACGHHLFGSASTFAGIAVKDWLAQSKRTGTIRVYGTPAEEGGAGKVYMVRAGLFKDVDVVLHWHPSDRNDASHSTSLANKSAKFRFHGLSAHAAGAPERGRSALDGVEAMDYMVNMMREHVPQETRIHYIITRGGAAPNVVPDFAEAYYYARSPNMRILDGVWERIVNAANGAALGTGTKMELEVTGAVYNVLPNEYLSGVMNKNLERIGGFSYTPEEAKFAEEIRKTLTDPPDVAVGSQEAVRPLRSGAVNSSSTDLADVSWTVPTVSMTAATFAPGVPAHSWQATACAGGTIGVKGMMVAAKSMALTTVDLFTDPAHIQKAKAEFDQKRGPNFKYTTRLADRKPALDYRK